MAAVLDEGLFDQLADRTLHKLERSLNEIDGLEADLESGILTVEFPDGLRFVINSHRAARQIWMAAVSSAWHFDPADDGSWRAARTGEALRPTLARLVHDRIGVSVAL